MEPKSGRFGFLPIGKTFPFAGGRFTLLDDFDAKSSAITTASNSDGYLYPPIQVTRRGIPEIVNGQILPEDQWDWETLPKSERPALLHGLPSTHELEFDGICIDNDLRKNDGAFMMYLAGYLFGYRLQFHGWWFDGRINVKTSHNILVADAAASKFFSASYDVWKSWPAQLRKTFTNILYMIPRSDMYEWDWERFMTQYMTLDACYRHAELKGEVRSRTHAGRLEAMCKHYGLYLNDGIVKDIVKLRNDLFHEALWDGGRPCTSGGETSSGLADILRGINQRLVPALLGFQTTYIRTHWDSLGTCGF